MLPIRTIIHPTDFSEFSNNAFQLACATARDYGARLIVAHVTTPPVMVSGEGVYVAPVEGYKEQLEEQLKKVLPSDPKVKVEHRLLEGDPATEILDLARQIKCDLIVMGTHGRTGIGRLLLGSVAEQVLRRAPCPVLTMKTPVREEKPGEEPVQKKVGEGVEATR